MTLKCRPTPTNHTILIKLRGRSTSYDHWFGKYKNFIISLRPGVTGDEPCQIRGEKKFSPTVARRHYLFSHSMGSNESKNAKNRTTFFRTSLFEISRFGCLTKRTENSNTFTPYYSCCNHGNVRAQYGPSLTFGLA